MGRDIHAMLPGSKLKSIALCVILALCLHSTEGDVSDQNQAVSHREKGRGGFLAATGSFRLSGLVPREEERSLGERNVVPHTIASWCAAHHLEALQPALEELGDSVHDLSLLTQEDIAHMQLKPLTARRLTAALKSSTLAPEGALLTSGDLTPAELDSADDLLDDDDQFETNELMLSILGKHVPAAKAVEHAATAKAAEDAEAAAKAAKEATAAAEAAESAAESAAEAVAEAAAAAKAAEAAAAAAKALAETAAMKAAEAALETARAAEAATAAAKAAREAATAQAAEEAAASAVVAAEQAAAAKDCPAIVEIKDRGMQAFMKETWHCKSGNYCLGKAATYFNRGKMAEYLDDDEAIFQRVDVKDFGKAGFCVLKRGYGMSENKAGLAVMVYAKLACTEDNICINSSKKFYGGFELSHRHYSSSKKLQCFNRYKGCRYFADRMRNGKFKMVPSNKATSGLTQAFMMA